MVVTWTCRLWLSPKYMIRPHLVPFSCFSFYLALVFSDLKGGGIDTTNERHTCFSSLLVPPGMR